MSAPKDPQPRQEKWPLRAEEASPRREDAPPRAKEDAPPCREDAPPRAKEDAPPCREDAPPRAKEKFMSDFSNFAGMDDEPFSMGFRGSEGVMNMIYAVLQKSGSLLGKFGLPNPPPLKPDPEFFRRMVQEELQKSTNFIMKNFDALCKKVDFAIESSVRNESHCKKIGDNFKLLEASIKEASDRAMAALTVEMRLLFETQLKELKAMHEKAVPKKSRVQKVDAVLTDLETADGFAERITKLTESVLYKLARLKLLFEAFNYMGRKPGTEKEPKQELLAAELEKLEQVSTKLKQLPVICMPLDLGQGKFSDIGRTSADLLHKIFPSGPHPEYTFSYSANASDGLRALMRGVGGPLSVNLDDLGSFYLKLKSTSSKHGVRVPVNDVGARLVIPEFFLNGVRGSVALPLPASYVKGKVHYLHEFGGALGCVQLGANPLLKLSCVFGLKAFSLGADIGYNPTDNLLTKCDVGLRYNINGFDAAAVFRKRLMNTVSGSVSYKWGTNAVAVEETYTHTSGVHQLYLGVAHLIDDATVVKARVRLHGRVGQAAEQERDPSAACLADQAIQSAEPGRNQSPVAAPRAKEEQELGRRVVGGIALSRRWGSCVAGLSCEADLHFTQPPSSPRFGIFVKFGAPKRSSV